MTVGPIPFTAIFEYFQIFELSDFEEFSYVMRRMDNVYLELNNKDVSSKDNKGKGKKSSGGNSRKNHKNKD